MAESLYEALLEVQQNLPVLTRDGENPHFRSSYLTLESLMTAVLPVLNEAGLLLIQSPADRDVPCLRTRIVHVPTGQFFEDFMPLSSHQETPQGQGSAITYARRYALVSILGLTAERDDDGTAAQPSNPPQRRSNGTRRPSRAASQVTPDGGPW